MVSIVMRNCERKDTKKKPTLSLVKEVAQELGVSVPSIRRAY